MSIIRETTLDPQGAIESSAHDERFHIATETTQPERNEDEILERLSYLRANLAHGFTQMPDAVRRDPTLSRSAKLVYEQLLCYMRQRDYCWPSQQRIADDIGSMSRRTVVRAIAELYERGYIEKWRRGLNRTNLYFVNPLEFVLPALASGKCQNDTSVSDTTAQQDTPDRHTNQTKGNQTYPEEIPSNHSTSACGTTAIGNRQPEVAAGSNETKPHPNPGQEAGPPKRAKRAEDAQATAIAATTGIPIEHLANLGVQTGRRPTPAFIERMVTDFCHDLGDRPASIKGSVTRATKVYLTACHLFREFQDDPEGTFIEMLYDARAQAQRATKVRYRGGAAGERVNRIPLFFYFLERPFEFTDDEIAFIRSDEPLLL